MIGRFAHLGTYHGLFRFREFLPCLAGGGLALVSFAIARAGGSPTWALVTALAAVAVNGAPIVFGAARGLWERQVNVDELVSLALLASLIQGEVLTAAGISFIMTLGSLVEEAVSDGARRSIESLAALAPQDAVRLDADGTGHTVPVDTIRVGDRVRVKPGERIPVDAVIESGLTAVDESAITGESLPGSAVPATPSWPAPSTIPAGSRPGPSRWARTRPSARWCGWWSRPRRKNPRWPGWSTAMPPGLPPRSFCACAGATWL